jgi:hypothetical protein
MKATRKHPKDQAVEAQAKLFVPQPPVSSHPDREPTPNAEHVMFTLWTKLHTGTLTAREGLILAIFELIDDIHQGGPVDICVDGNDPNSSTWIPQQAQTAIILILLYAADDAGVTEHELETIVCECFAYYKSRWGGDDWILPNRRTGVPVQLRHLLGKSTSKPTSGPSAELLAQNADLWKDDDVEVEGGDDE